MLPTKEQRELAVHLKDAILAAYDPQAVILFGSLGRRDTDEFSDVDLLVIIETDRDTNELSKGINDDLDYITMEKHIIVRTPWDFFRQWDIPGTLDFSAVKEGRILFIQKNWPIQHLHPEPYSVRKQAVLDQEYIQTAYQFLARAESSLEMGNLFRCRDYTRFAVIKAIKGIFVSHNINPPRDTDLVTLIHIAKKLEHALAKHDAFIRELNGHCPDPGDAVESRRSRRMIRKTAEFLECVIALYASDQQASAGAIKRQGVKPKRGDFQYGE